jgi:predicted GIY-YIG superfamily endonuclease
MLYVYILKCADNSYYTGMTADLQHRFVQHQSGVYEGYTSTRLPVQLVWSQAVQTENEAFTLEKQIKGWSRAKKEALIHNDFGEIHAIVTAERKQRKKQKDSPSTKKPQ